MKNIRAVIFDIDETLVDRKAAFLKLCDYLIDKYAKDYPFQMSRDELIKYLVKVDKNGYSPLEDIIPKLDPVWKLPLSPAEFVQERNSIFGKLTVPYPKTYEVLEALKGKYILGVITNGFSHVQREKIITVKIESYFEDILVSGDVDYSKPDPRIFALSCRRLGVEPEEAVYVEDHYRNDITGALGAGITPIWINNDLQEHPEYTGIRVSSLGEILNYL